MEDRACRFFKFNENQKAKGDGSLALPFFWNCTGAGDDRASEDAEETEAGAAGCGLVWTGEALAGAEIGQWFRLKQGLWRIAR